MSGGETALAEAEIEYAEDPCHSIYVKFRVTDDKGLLTKLGAKLPKIQVFRDLDHDDLDTAGKRRDLCRPEFEYALP